MRNLSGTRKKNLGQLKFKLLNIQGLTNTKITEIQEEIDQDTIFCLTETQKKWNNIKTNHDLQVLSRMRSSDERKGGGLMLIYRKNAKIDLKVVENKNSDNLIVEGAIRENKIRIVLSYFRTGNSQDVYEYNTVLKNEIEVNIEKAEENEQYLLLLGDYNGHLGYLGPQIENKTGKMINDLILRNNLILLNNDNKCKGTFTWERGIERSVLDLVMVNHTLYEKFRGMEIDEKKEKVDISDHNLLEVEFNIARHPGKKSILIEHDYYRTDEKSLDEYLSVVREKLILCDEINIEIINEIIKEAADLELKTTYRRRTDGNDNVEAPWINNEIRQEISNRRDLNRKHRNEIDTEKKLQYFHEYKQQKIKVANLIVSEMWKYEKKQVYEILDKTNNNRNLFLNIKKLKGECVSYENDMKIYSEDGFAYNAEEEIRALKSYWGGIYQMHENNIGNIWNETEQRKYEQDLLIIEEYGTDMIEEYVYNDQMDETLEIRNTVREANQRRVMANHSEIEDLEKKYREMAIMKMDIQPEDVEQVLKGLKNRKAPGPDGLKNELYKKLKDDRFILNTLTECFNDIVETGNAPEEWKNSRTVMIPKTSKPRVDELRPVALTNSSYKVFMTLIKNNLENHILLNGMKKVNQAGFTKGGRIQDNLFILKEMIEAGFIWNESTILIAVDFKKAYDSVKREMLIEILKDYRVQRELLDFIASTYQGDKTRISLNSQEIIMNISNGIRQGCTASTVLFKLITYKIIEKLDKECNGVRYGSRKLVSLFFADDGLLLSSNIEDARLQIATLTTEGRKYGLEINKDKSQCLIFNMKEKPVEIEGIEVTDQIKYLGIMLKNTREVFSEQRIKMINQAKQMANMSYSVVSRSCHRTMIGKTYWKCIVLPSVLFGAELVNFRETDLKQLQIAENSVLRVMLNAPKYACISAMQGEIGISSMRVRIARMKLQYYRSILQGTNDFMKEILGNIRTRDTKWFRETRKYMEMFGVENDIQNLSKEELNCKIAQKFDEEWKKEIESKVSLRLYKQNKETMQEEKCYDNRPASTIWFRARTNCLQLNDRNRFGNQETSCKLCQEELEDLEHFILDCKALELERSYSIVLQRPRLLDRDETLGNFLYSHDAMENKKEILYNMWRKRRKLIENMS